MMQDVELIAVDVPLACTLTESEQKKRGEENNELFKGVQQVKELADGYALCFPGGDT